MRQMKQTHTEKQLQHEAATHTEKGRENIDPPKEINHTQKTKRKHIITNINRMTNLMQPHTENATSSGCRRTQKKGEKTLSHQQKTTTHTENEKERHNPNINRMTNLMQQHTENATNKGGRHTQNKQ